MNIGIQHYDDQEFSHDEKVQQHKKGSRPNATRRSVHAGRRDKSPAQLNGMHRRRRKRMSW